MTDERGRLLAVPAVLGGMASYQFGAAVAKSLFPVFGATGTAGLRIGLSMIVLWALWRPWRRWPGLVAMRAIVPYGLALGTMNLLFYLALARLPLGIAVAIEFTGPLALATIGSRRLLDLLWAGLVTSGLALLLDPVAAFREAAPGMAPGAASSRIDPLGVACALGAGLCWALYIVFGRRVGGLVGQQVGAPQATALGMAVASLAVVPFCLTAMAPVLQDTHRLVAAVLVAVLCSALPYSLEMTAMRHMSTRAFGILMSLEPALAALSGLVLLGERLSPLSWLAILCIVLASAGSALAGERLTAQEAHQGG